MSKVLLLESDQVLAHNIAHFLRARRHKVFWSAEPQAAIETADKHQPDAIIMDIVLGGHSGIEFLYELRSYPEWQSLPVIVLSSAPEREFSAYVSEMADLNIAGFYHKPHVSLAEIMKAVDLAIQPVKK